MERVHAWKVAIAALVAGAAIGSAATAEAAKARHQVPRWFNNHCATEDSYNCYWISRRTGEVIYNRLMPGTNSLCTWHVKYRKLDRCSQG